MIELGDLREGILPSNVESAVEETMGLEGMVRLACVAHGTNYYRRGRTVEDMGLKGLRVSEIMRYVEEGQIKPVYTLTEGRPNLPRQRAALPSETPQPLSVLSHSAERQAEQVH